MQISIQNRLFFQGVRLPKATVTFLVSSVGEYHELCVYIIYYIYIYQDLPRGYVLEPLSGDP